MSTTLLPSQSSTIFTDAGSPLLMVSRGQLMLCWLERSPWSLGTEMLVRDLHSPFVDLDVVSSSQRGPHQRVAGCH